MYSVLSHSKFYVPINTQQLWSVWLNFHVQYIANCTDSSYLHIAIVLCYLWCWRWYSCCATNYSFSGDEENYAGDSGSPWKRIYLCVFVLLDFVQWTVAISLLCQPWQGEGKQKRWPLLTYGTRTKWVPNGPKGPKNGYLIRPLPVYWSLWLMSWFEFFNLS